MGISREQALDCFAGDDLIGIGMEADAVRRRLHPEGVVTYAIDAPIRLSSTNGDPTPIYATASAILHQGGTGMTLQSADKWPVERLETLLCELKGRFPGLRLQGASAPDLLSLASSSGLAITDLLRRLKSTGLDSLGGEGETFPGARRWLEVHRAAHSVGIPTSASMVIGAGESAEDRVALLEAIHSLQQETCGFQAFRLETHTSGRELDDPTAVEYLKTLAISRMMLDNIPHCEANWQQQGLKVLQMALRFGGNDAGSARGTQSTASEEEVRRIIRDAGFRPAQRDTLYRTMFLI